MKVNAVVFWTLNTSGVAPQTYPDPNGPPALPGGGWYGNTTLNTPSLYAGGGNNDRQHFPEIPPTPARSDTLVLWHHGHSQPCDSSGCHIPWIDDQLDWLNGIDFLHFLYREISRFCPQNVLSYAELGLDAMVLQMPGYQCNYDQPEAGWVPGNGTPGHAKASVWGGGCNHSWWKGLEEQGVATGRFFVEPVVLTINYAKEVLGYKRIIMCGCTAAETRAPSRSRSIVAGQDGAVGRRLDDDDGSGARPSDRAEPAGRGLHPVQLPPHQHRLRAVLRAAVQPGLRL